MISLFGNKRKESDEQLLSRFINKGDSEALGILYQRYAHLVLGISMKYLKDSIKAEDAVMDVYEKIQLNIHRFQVDNFKAWICTVAKNHSLMQLRSGKTNPEFISADFSVVERIVESDVESDQPMHLTEKEEKEQLLQALELAVDQLTDVQATCIRLFYLENKSYQDITDQTGLDFKQVKSNIQNGKRMLKIVLQKQFPA